MSDVTAAVRKAKTPTDKLKAAGVDDPAKLDLVTDLPTLPFTTKAELKAAGWKRGAPNPGFYLGAVTERIHFFYAPIDLGHKVNDGGGDSNTPTKSVGITPTTP